MNNSAAEDAASDAIKFMPIAVRCYTFYVAPPPKPKKSKLSQAKRKQKEAELLAALKNIPMIARPSTS